LAIREQSAFLSSVSFFALTKLMIHYAYWRGHDDLVMTIHPKHYRFYWRHFRMYPLGPHRPHQSAGGNPAVCHRIDLRHLKRNIAPELWEQYFSTGVPVSQLDRPPMQPADHAYFSARSGIAWDANSTVRAVRHDRRA
jgi:hypothetical protein